MGDSHLSRRPLRRIMMRALLLAAPAAARPLEDVIKAGVLRVAVYQDYKPYSLRDGEKLVGVARALSESLACGSICSNCGRATTSRRICATASGGARS